MKKPTRTQSLGSSRESKKPCLEAVLHHAVQVFRALTTAVRQARTWHSQHAVLLCPFATLFSTHKHLQRQLCISPCHAQFAPDKLSMLHKPTCPRLPSCLATTRTCTQPVMHIDLLLHSSSATRKHPPGPACRPLSELGGTCCIKHAYHAHYLQPTSYQHNSTAH
jgi:hypothetical protein